MGTDGKASSDPSSQCLPKPPPPLIMCGIYHLGRSSPNSFPPHTLIQFPNRESSSYFRSGFLFTSSLGPRSSEADNGAGGKRAESPDLSQTELWLRTWAQASSVAPCSSSVFETTGCVGILDPLYMSPVILGNHFSVPRFSHLPMGNNNRIYIRGLW